MLMNFKPTEDIQTIVCILYATFHFFHLVNVRENCRESWYPHIQSVEFLAAQIS